MSLILKTLKVISDDYNSLIVVRRRVSRQYTRPVLSEAENNGVMRRSGN